MPAKALITPPAVLPVTLDQAKTHLRVETADDDQSIGELIAAAVAHVEIATGRSLVTQTWRVYLDAWPAGDLIELPVSPVRAISDIRVYDAQGVPVTLGAGQWALDSISDPPRLVVSGPPLPEQAMNGVEIDVETGFGDSGADVPDTLRRAILVLTAHWYEFRGVAGDAAMASEPPGFSRLVAPFRRPRL